jgi:hypothetical protein
MNSGIPPQPAQGPTTRRCLYSLANGAIFGDSNNLLNASSFSGDTCIFVIVDGFIPTGVLFAGYNAYKDNIIT